jgi:replicative DNA helicase
MEIEAAILNSLTVTSNVQKAWDSGLKGEHFEEPLRRGIFNFIMQYWSDDAEHRAPTIEVLLEEYPHFKAGEPDESLDWMIKKVHERYRRNKVQNLNERTAELIESKEPGSSADALKLLIDEGFEIAQSLSDRRSVANLADPENIQSRRNRYNQRARFTGEIRGAPTGFEAIDQHFYGILPGEMACIAGYAGTGKSWGLGVAAIAAARAGYRPYIVTLEIPKDDFEDRLDCIMSGVPYTKVLRGDLDREELTRLHAAQDELRDLSLIIDNPADGERTVQMLTTKAVQAGADYLLVDQMSFVEARRHYPNLRDKYGEVLKDFKVKIAAGDDKIALYMAVQMNREQKKNSNKTRGDTTNLADAAFVEQYADHVFALTQTNEMLVNQAMCFDIFKCRRQGKKAWLLNWQLKNRTHFSVNQDIPLD